MAPKRRLEVCQGSFGEAACKRLRSSAKFRTNTLKTTETVCVPVPMVTSTSNNAEQQASEKQTSPSIDPRRQAELDKELFSAVKSTYTRKENTLEIVKQLIDKGASVNAKDEEGSPLLFKALYCAGFDIIELLLQSGADPNCTDAKGVGSLSQAVGCDAGMGSRASYNHLKLLIDSGANINQKNKKNETVLWDAVETAERGMVEFLLQHGADASILNKDGNSILYCLAHVDWNDIGIKEFDFREYFIKCSRLLQSYGAKLSHADLHGKYGATLERYIEYGEKREAQLFLKHWKKGIHNVENPLHTAAGNNSTKVLGLLLKSGLFDVNQRDSRGQTPLHIAARCDHEYNLKLLLEYGADPDAETKRGAETPYLIARKEKNWPHVRLLLNNGAKKPSGSDVEDSLSDEEGNGCIVS